MTWGDAPRGWPSLCLNTVLATFTTWLGFGHCTAASFCARRHVLCHETVVKGSAKRKQPRGSAPLSDSNAACSRMLSTCVIAAPAQQRGSLAAFEAGRGSSVHTDLGDVLIREVLEVTRRSIPVHNGRSANRRIKMDQLTWSAQSSSSGDGFCVAR